MGMLATLVVALTVHRHLGAALSDRRSRAHREPYAPRRRESSSSGRVLAIRLAPPRAVVLLDGGAVLRPGELTPAASP